MCLGFVYRIKQNIGKNNYSNKINTLTAQHSISLSSLYMLNISMTKILVRFVSQREGVSVGHT